jgi:hypothetical protein
MGTLGSCPGAHKHRDPMLIYVCFALYVFLMFKHWLCWKYQYTIYSPTKVKHHLTCFNNIVSNNELISNRFAVFVTCTRILTYLWNRLLIDFYLCVYDRVCKVPRVLFNICVCERKLIFLCRVLSFIFYWFGMVLWKLTIPERWQAVGMHNCSFSHRRVADHFRVNHSIILRLMQHFRQTGNVTDRTRAGRLAKRHRERTGSYPDGHGNGHSVQLVHFVVI